jgi:putative oxidoreductase
VNNRSTASLPDRLAGHGHNVLLLAGRLALGVIFVESGFGKLMTIGAFTASLANRGVPGSSVLGVVGPLVEFFGGLMIVFGFKTRYAALLLIVFTAVATGIAHRFWELAEAARRAQEVHFFKNVAIIGGFLLLFVTGGGRFSLDRFRHK